MQNNQVSQDIACDQKTQDRQRRVYATLIILLILAIISLMFVLAPWAKYAFAGESEDSARVAKFVVVATDTQEDKDLEINDATFTQSYTFKVSNQNPDTAEAINEVETDYDVVVTFPSEFTYNNSGVNMTLKNGEAEAVSATTVSDDKKTYTFSKVGTFSANTAKADSLTLSFDAPDQTKVQEGEWKAIKVSAIATQVD